MCKQDCCYRVLVLHLEFLNTSEGGWLTHSVLARAVGGPLTASGYISNIQLDNALKKNSNQYVISMPGSTDTLLSSAADHIFQQNSTYLNMKMNNTVSGAAVILCTVMLNEVLCLHTALVIPQIVLVVSNLSGETGGFVTFLLVYKYKS